MFNLIKNLSLFLQDIYNNPFGDFTNQFISDVAIGKSTEITDLVMQQQPDNAFCNLTDTMNNINNNKFNNAHDENNFMVDEVLHEEQPSEQGAQNVLVLNDDNNNSNDNFGGPDMGPETDVDAIDEEFQANAAAAAVACEKEKTQMEFKETEDVADRVDIINFGEDHSAAIYGSLENKIFEEMSLQHPDMMKGNNPFTSAEDAEIIAEAMKPAAEFFDNKIMEQHIEQHIEEFADKFGDLANDEAFGVTMESVADTFKKELTSANEEVAFEEQQQQQQPEAGESFKIRLTGIVHEHFIRKLVFFLIWQTRLNRDPILYSSVKRAFELQTLFFGNGLALMVESLFA